MNINDIKMQVKQIVTGREALQELADGKILYSKTKYSERYFKLHEFENGLRLAFWHCDHTNTPDWRPEGYCISNFIQCEFTVYDELPIPKFEVGEYVTLKDGNMTGLAKINNIDSDTYVLDGFDAIVCSNEKAGCKGEADELTFTETAWCVEKSYIETEFRLATKKEIAYYEALKDMIEEVDND